MISNHTIKKPMVSVMFGHGKNVKGAGMQRLTNIQQVRIVTHYVEKTDYVKE